MSTEPGQRKGVAAALTDAVAADMAKIDEMLARVRADLETLERWGAPMKLAPEWRTRLGLPAEESRASKVIRMTKHAGSSLAQGAIYLAAQPEMTDILSTMAEHSLTPEEVEARRKAMRQVVAKYADALEAARSVEENQAELSSVDYAVKVLSARPDKVMDLADIAIAMREAGWETRGDIGNVTAAVLGKAVERYAHVRRVGRGQYMWAESTGLDCTVPELSLTDRSSEQEAEASRS